MLVLVETLDGKTLEIHMEKWERVEDLKEKIYDKEGIVPDHQRIIFSGWVLEDGLVFYDKCVEIRTSNGVTSPTKIDEIFVHVVTRVRGGGNGLYHHPVWNDQNPSGLDDSSDSDLDSDHLPQNDVPLEIPTVDDPSIKEQEEKTESSSKGSRGPRRSIINKLKKWIPWNCFRFEPKHE